MRWDHLGRATMSRMSEAKVAAVAASACRAAPAGSGSAPCGARRGRLGLGIDPRLLISGVEILQGGGGPGHYQQERRGRARAGRRRPTRPDDSSVPFCIHGDRWTDVFQKAGKRYTRAQVS